MRTHSLYVLQHFSINITKYYIRLRLKEIKIFDLDAQKTFNGMIYTVKRSNAEKFIECE